MIFWAGLIVRVLYITIAHTYRINPVQDHFDFGYEMGRVARALVTGYGYADPFNGHSGPTAWVPPLYPLLLAAVFKLFGVYTALSAWVILTLNSVFSAATSIFVFKIAARCYNRKVALWSAWIWALYPAAMQYATRWIWEMALTAMLFTAVFALSLRMRGITPRGQGAMDEPRDEKSQQTTKQWLLFALLWALISLSNSTLLLFLPACGIWILAGARNKAPAVRRAFASGLVFLAVVSPWMIRNYRVFHEFVPFRSNFGAELYMGNNPAADGMPWGKTVNGEYQVRRYTQMGEVAYANEQGSLAKSWIARHPTRFLELSLKRFYCFWSAVPHAETRHTFLVLVRNINFCVPNILAILGLALSLKRRTPAAALFLWAFILLPFTYYFITPGARFRHPLEPLIVILSVFLIQSAQPRKARSS
ncbi:MAG TPA: glycosyltransferase family 39 protein [Silvibacterium sp.]|nr:glycosyltransferase family 39 protein [Silvibacterium sp.]